MTKQFWLAVIVMQFPIVVVMMVVAIILGLFPSPSMAAPNSSNVRIEMGRVNGDITAGQQTVRVSKVLANPVLMSVAAADVDNLKALLINDAQLVKQDVDKVLIRMSHPLPLPDGVAVTEMYLGLWVDGQQVPLGVNTAGSAIELAVPEEFKQVELRAIGSVFIELPRQFRGNFDIDIDIDGRSS